MLVRGAGKFGRPVGFEILPPLALPDGVVTKRRDPRPGHADCRALVKLTGLGNPGVAARHEDRWVRPWACGKIEQTRDEKPRLALEKNLLHPVIVKVARPLNSRPQRQNCSLLRSNYMETVFLWGRVVSYPRGESEPKKSNKPR